MPSDARVVFRSTDGVLHTLHSGDIVGRLRSAALRIDDPRISEAHALVSLRSGALRLLALRGGLAVDRQRMGEVELESGLTVRLAKDVTLEVIDVVVPDASLGISLDGAPAELLLGGAASIVFDPEPGLSPRFVPDAPAQLWSDGLGWRLGFNGRSEVLEPGQSYEIDGHRVTGVEIPLAGQGLDATVRRGRVHAPLHLVAAYDSVHVHREGREPLLLSGIQARIVSELVAFGGPTDWELVAAEVWRDLPRHNLRRRWDVNLGRLRSRLATEGIRSNLINSDGTGRIELVMLDGDTVDDRT